MEVLLTSDEVLPALAAVVAAGTPQVCIPLRLKVEQRWGSG